MSTDPELLFDGPNDAAMTVALAHGAGAGMDSPFLAFFAAGLGERGFRVARFEYPYMADQRVTGKKRPPDREPVLRATWLKVVEQLGSEGLVIGGKSMGGRIASLVADEARVAGLVCLGYPFHPVGKPDRLRVEHLASIKTPTLIVQDERDPFGSREEVAGYQLSPAVRVMWVEDGDHSFKPRKASGRTEQLNWAAALEEVEEFLADFPGHKGRDSGPLIAADDRPVGRDVWQPFSPQSSWFGRGRETTVGRSVRRVFCRGWLVRSLSGLFSIVIGMLRFRYGSPRRGGVGV